MSNHLDNCHPRWGIKFLTPLKVQFYVLDGQPFVPNHFFPTNNLTLRTKPSVSVFMHTTFAIGHWLRLASVFSRTISPFWKFLCFLFHLWRDWSDHRNSFCHLTQTLLAICCMHLHLFLLYSSDFTKWPGGGKTTLDFIMRMLLGHIGYLLCTSPNVSTIKGLVCAIKTSVLYVPTEFVFPKHPPYASASMLGGSCAN